MTNSEIRFVHMDPVNFQDFPVGGTLSFSRQLIEQFKSEVALVGLVTDDIDPVGKWFVKEINGISYKYFGINRYKKSGKRPLVPIRIQTFISLLFYLPRIRKIGIRNVFTRSPQFLFALKMFKWQSVCFCFAGIANSVAHSRYKYLRVLAVNYEKRLFRTLKEVADVILASADRESIADAVKRTGNILDPNDILVFPTRFDPKVFSPQNKTECRNRLNINNGDILLVATGRLSWIKDWKLLIDSAMHLYSIENLKNIKIIFAGEGEDREKIENYIKHLTAKDVVRLVGKQKQIDLAVYLNAADVFVMASHYEGWPTSLVEAMACGCSIVTTNVSAASDIVTEGRNGYIIKDRDPVKYARMIKQALELTDVKEYSLLERNKFSVEYLKSDLEKVWLSKV
jgi:glycosyltransferase involved in cell wall biosynthesis